MSGNNTDTDKYNQDSRTPCKYGENCYQRNPDHHKKFKHPPEKEIKKEIAHSSKKLKVETSSNEIREIVTKHDVGGDDSIAEENGSTYSDSKMKKVNNDVSDSDVTDDETGEKDKVKSKITSSNDVSDSDETDGEESEVTKEKTDNEETIIGSLHHKEFIKQKFLVDMPEDFYQFWNFCKKVKPNNPSDALKDVGLILVGPFDVLMGKFDNVKKSDKEYLVHWRYYRDPPEFQTILKGDDKTGYHIGYFRDSPEELPVILASNSAKKDGILHQMGGNIFTAVNIYLDELKKSGDPFKRMHVGKIQAAVKKEAESQKIDLSQRTNAMISREKKIVTRTFNKIGLVVPRDRKSQLGYRELAFENKELATLLTKFQNALPEQKAKYLSELQPVFTNTSIATDECDFGTGIELGWNIISHGVDSLNSTVSKYLTVNYNLLNREAFAKIAEAHMNKRRQGCNLSII